MIIVRISGGLGNQLFQYSFARAIKENTGLEVKLDTDYYNNQKLGDAPREFLLEQFKITLPVATESDLQKIGFANAHSKQFIPLFQRKIQTFVDSFIPLNSRKFIIEPSFTYHKELSGKIRNNSYISGIWQSEKYFKSTQTIIRSELQLKNPLSKSAQEFLNKINKTNSVSLHIRRGDYTQLQKIQPLPLEYYKKSIGYIKRNVKNPHFYIFSDDIKWVKNNLKIDGEKSYVSNSDIKDYEEQFLMSNCQHNILANSTFSWWAAWLNNNHDKIVIAPERWFSIDIDTSDLIPKEWVRL